MPAPEGESQLPEQDVDIPGVVGSDLDEVERRRLGDRRQPGRGVGSQVPVRVRLRGDDVLHPGERAPCLARCPGDFGLPEDVVEHLERQRPVVPGAEDVRHEGSQVERTLAREQPVVARPGQHVHGQQRSVGELEEEDLGPGNLLDRAGIVAAGEDMEAVEAGSDGVVVRELHDSPRPTVVVDEPAPGQGLVGDPYAVRRGLLAQPPQLRGGDLVVVDRGRGDVAAHEHRVRAESLHQRELRAGPAQDALELGLGDALCVAKGLVEIESQAEPGGQRHDLLRAGGRGDQVGLKDLNAVEARVGRGVQLVGERAAEADRGDRGAHRLTPPGVQEGGDERGSRPSAGGPVPGLRRRREARGESAGSSSPCSSAVHEQRARMVASPC